MSDCLFLVFLATLCMCTHGREILKDISGNVQLKYAKSNDGIGIELVRNGKIQVSGTIGMGKNLKDVSCIGSSLCTFGNNEQLSIRPIENGFNITWYSEDPSDVYEDCYDLTYGQWGSTRWFGGPQRYNQVWPLEKMILNGSEPYVIKKSDNFGVAERYWLNSRGTYFYIDEKTPLWIDQNNKHDNQVCFRAEAKAPYINRKRVKLVYALMAMDDLKTAHLHAVNNFLGKPKGHPNEKMIAEPIWTTWAKYKRPINDALVLQFANEIRSHGYSGGQLEIDDAWEKCYGAQEFDTTKFADINNTIATLHKDNWRVSLWIHPFVNDDCQNNSAIGQSLGYFVRNTANQTKAVWWNSENAHQIDFTQPKAAEWWTNRVRKLQDLHGIDSFKFDAGESDYANQPNVYSDEVTELTPNILTQRYIETCIQFGDLIEVRSSFRGQQYGEFIRMLDKDSLWGLENGLATLVTTLLQLNMNGYGMVLPDMIGGNGYQSQPTGDLIVRWTQANTFMPSMQFSYLPWDYKDSVSYDIEGIVKKYVDLHEKYATNIIKAMNQSISNGSPVNPPIWWLDPADATALASDDEYLLGEDILVAPVLVENAVSRDVYLPKGQWKDGNTGTVYTGPITLNNYPAPIEVLPYFIRI